jgi:Bacteriophage replication protein O
MKNHEGKFLGFYTPRYTQVPDELFDELLSELSGAELKVLLYVIRRTFGFKKDSDLISLSQMVSGIEKKDGTVLDKGTGLHKDSVIKSAKSLVSKGILLRNRKNSVKHGYTATEYALNIRNNSLSEYPTSDLVGEKRQALPEKSDIQDTDKQNTFKTFRNASNKQMKRTPVDKSLNDKHEYIVDLILQTCRDKQSIVFYRKVVRLLSEQDIFEALSHVREAIQLGRIRERPGAMFTDLIKRKAKELGIELVNEIKENIPKHEKIRKSSKFYTPAEIFVARES